MKHFCDKKGILYTHFPAIRDNLVSCLSHLHVMGSSNKFFHFAVRDKDKDKEKDKEKGKNKID